MVNALTKYIGGHGNALGGSITDTGCSTGRNSQHLRNYKGPKKTLWGITQIRKKGLRDWGGTLAAEQAHHLAVGARRCRFAWTGLRQRAGAGEFLRARGSCGPLPGSRSHPQHALAGQLFGAYGALLSFDSIRARLFRLSQSPRHVVLSSNLGDNRTLAIPVAHTIFYEMGAERRANMGIADSLISISVGIEDRDDLIADFAQALA